jgi:exodeoxyribonuclease-5
MVKNYYNNHWELRAEELVNKNLIKGIQKDALMSMLNSPDKENLVLAEELLSLKISEALIEGLNKDQLNAFTEIISYLRYPEHHGVVLKGYAGTGKTFLVKRIIEYITTIYPNRRIAVTAPTNKAVHVLSKNSPFTDESAVFEEWNAPEERIVFSTIHKLLGLKEKITSSGEQKFVSSKDTSILEYKYLIVDEVSMLNDEIFLQLMKFEGKVQFIFMGDPAQIPPVGKEHCIPFMETYPMLPKRKDNVPTRISLKKLELKEIMRQKGEHPIIRISMLLRENLDKLNPIEYKTCLTKDNKGIVIINSATDRHKIRKVIDLYFHSKQYKENIDFIKIIAWRNKTVKYLNQIVRESLFGKDCDRFNIGDKLIANAALFSRSPSRWGEGFEYQVKAYTSEEFIIEKKEKMHKSFTEFVKNSPIASFEGDFWKLIVLSLNSNEDLPCRTTLYVVHEDCVKDYNNRLAALKAHATSNRCINSWRMYFNMLKWNDNVIYNYAITAHKSQGSTYNNVILIEEDLDFNMNIIERNRIKYTAYTRAKDKMYVLR